MLSSLQAGLAAVPEECQAAFFHPCDMPAIQPGTLHQLIDALAAAPAHTLAAIPTFQAKRGHPVLIRSSWISEFMALPAGSSARTLLESTPGSIVEVAVTDAGVCRDFDTRDEYAAAFGARP
jgi:molybdenum cofactor cytidylyltransferase